MTAAPAKQITAQQPDAFCALIFSVDETELGLRVLTRHVRSLKHSHSSRNLSALKLDAEQVAKVAGQIAVLNQHLAGVAVKLLNRRGRV